MNWARLRRRLTVAATIQRDTQLRRDRDDNGKGWYWWDAAILAAIYLMIGLTLTAIVQFFR